MEQKKALRMFSTKMGAALTIMFYFVVGMSVVHTTMSNELKHGERCRRVSHGGAGSESFWISERFIRR